MDELCSLMQEILIELREINSHLSDLRGSGLNSMDDISNKLDDVVQEINSIKGPTGYDLTDIHSALSNIEVNTSGL
jgi:hypothetical protein